MCRLPSEIWYKKSFTFTAVMTSQHLWQSTDGLHPILLKAHQRLTEIRETRFLFNYKSKCWQQAHLGTMGQPFRPMWRWILYFIISMRHVLETLYIINNKFLWNIPETLICKFTFGCGCFCVLYPCCATGTLTAAAAWWKCASPHCRKCGKHETVL